MCQKTKEDNSLYFRALDFVAEAADIKLDDLVNKQTFPLPVYRYAIFSILREQGWSWMRIGRASGKSHATAMHGIATLQDLIQTKNEKALFIIDLLKDFKI